MKIGSIKSNVNMPKFKSLANNKHALNCLEQISDHGATFIAATSAIMAIGVKPVAIALTPKVEKENKEYAATNAMASGLIKFLMVEAIALPIENGLKKINENPIKYLSDDTINNLKGTAKNIVDSQDYKTLTHILKQLSGVITSIPKSKLTVILIPILMDLIFKKRKKSKKEVDIFSYNQTNKPKIFNEINSDISFKGGFDEIAAKGLSKIINNKNVQNFIKKNNFKDANIAKNMSTISDLLVTGSFIYSTAKSKKIEKERKKALCFNNLISMGIFLVCGHTADNLIQKLTKKSMQKFAEEIKNNPKVHKYLDGINILRSTLTFAVIYYAILPIFSTFIAEKADKLTTKQ